MLRMIGPLGIPAMLVGFVLALGPVSAPAASASCAPWCGDTMIRHAKSIVLARYRESDGEYAVLDVLDVLKGPTRASVRVRRETLAFISDWRSIRWIVLGWKPTGPVFEVLADGQVAWPHPTGPGPEDYPWTLRGWYRKLGLPLPDTATASRAQGAAQSATPAALVAVACIGVVLALRRQPRRRQMPSAG